MYRPPNNNVDIFIYDLMSKAKELNSDNNTIIGDINVNLKNKIDYISRNAGL